MSEIKASPEDVSHAYRLLLGREADKDGYTSHLKLLDEMSPSTTALAKGFFGSREFLERFGCIVRVPMGDRPPAAAILQSQACTQQQIESPAFLHWAWRLHERPGGLHRKLWEWCFIAQALYERNSLNSDAHGLGFAVGTEQLSALFAAMGCSVLATDLDRSLAEEAGWVNTNQHASSLGELNSRNLCSQDLFAARVRFRNVDMRSIPTDLRGFDFLWSSCAMEHLGSLQLGTSFVVEAMACLRPGGVAVHTTELNCDSDVGTVETGGSVIYRNKDLRELACQLESAGHKVEPLNFYLGDTEADGYVDEPPYGGMAHIKLRLGGYASTSFGIIVTKGI